ncbi:4189_t:CDS:2 [Gigaspora margarita]|uniref:4189_t:CDS:1 n=1 Tax=Gigaspora margarita TaxID=4874 RepID=A0ABN7UXZ0_GIGMA|nr:4189_t:CDS:2 [Gigaspora margarita]
MVNFWKNIANIINERFSTNYTGYQCKGKFQNLVRDYTEIEQGVDPELGRDTLKSFILVFGRDQTETIICGLKTLETVFDQVHNANTSSRRRELRCRNHTPPPTYDEVSSMLSMGRHESTTDQITHPKNVANNNVNQPDVENSVSYQGNASGVNDAGGNSDNNPAHNENENSNHNNNNLI